MSGFRYISLDIETTGLDWDKHQVLSIGAIIDDLSNKRVNINELPRWECLVHWPLIVGDPFALAMNAWILTILAVGKEEYEETCEKNEETAIPILRPGAVMGSFCDWLIKNQFVTSTECMVGKSINFTGKNFAMFDLRFLETNFDFRKWVKLSHRVLDPGSMYFKPGLHNERLPSTEQCLDLANMGDLKGRHDHLVDAAAAIQLIRFYHDLECEGYITRRKNGGGSS